GSAEGPDRDLAPVGDQYLLEHESVLCRYSGAGVSRHSALLSRPRDHGRRLHTSSIGAQWMWLPPLMSMVVPVRELASSLGRKGMAGGAFWGGAPRPGGVAV